MKIENNKVVQDKEEYLINSLFMGLAVQYLVELSNKTFEEWKDILSIEAEKQLETVKAESSEALDDIINECVAQSAS